MKRFFVIFGASLFLALRLTGACAVDDPKAKKTDDSKAKKPAQTAQPSLPALPPSAIPPEPPPQVSTGTVHVRVQDNLPAQPTQEGRGTVRGPVLHKPDPTRTPEPKSKPVPPPSTTDNTKKTKGTGTK